MSKKTRNPVVIAAIISVIVVFASVIILIVVTGWDWGVGIVLLITLLPASFVFACLTIFITAIVSSKRKKGAEVITPDATIQYASEQPKTQKYCPNCGTPFTLGLKQCANCAYEL